MSKVCREIDAAKSVEEVVEMLEADDSRSAGSVDEFIATEACWTYPQPTPAFESIRDHWAFYAQALDERLPEAFGLLADLTTSPCFDPEVPMQVVRSVRLATLQL